MADGMSYLGEALDIGLVERVDRLRAAASDSLDAAWAEAEAALPEGVTFSLTRAIRPAPEGAKPTYYVTVSSPWTGDAIEFQLAGPTPTAALRALAAKLREAKG